MKLSNIEIFPRQKDVADFYNAASVVLNLSDKNSFIETFGMTVLEAMSCGLPVIVPTVGGIAEMVEDGYNGFKTDAGNLDTVAGQIEKMLSDEGLYRHLASNALACSEKFNAESMVDQIISNLE